MVSRNAWQNIIELGVTAAVIIGSIYGVIRVYQSQQIPSPEFSHIERCSVEAYIGFPPERALNFSNDPTEVVIFKCPSTTYTGTGNEDLLSRTQGADSVEVPFYHYPKTPMPLRLHADEARPLNY